MSVVLVNCTHIEELNERILRCYESFRREDSLSSRKKLAYAFIDVLADKNDSFIKDDLNRLSLSKVLDNILCQIPPLEENVFTVT